MRPGAWGWCTGMTQRDGNGREVGGGFRMGNTCKPMAVSFQCMKKSTTNKKIIIIKKIKIKIKQEGSKKNIYFCFIAYAKAFACVDHKLLKILRGIGIPEYLTCLLRNLYVSLEATVRTRHRTTNWFKTGKRA